MIFTRKKTIDFLIGFKSLFEEKLNLKTSSIVLKNKKLSQAEFEHVEELKQKYIPLFAKLKEYNEKRFEVIRDEAEKDEKGNVKEIRGQVFFPNEEIRKECELKLIKFDEEYSELKEEQQKFDDEFNDFLKEEIDLPFVKIPESGLPSEMSPAQFEILEELIEWEE